MPYSIAQIHALSLVELDQLIRSERKRLLDENIKEISPTILAAFTAKHSKSISILDKQLEQAGRNGLLEPRKSQLQYEPKDVFTNPIGHHRYTVRQMVSLINFIITEEKYLVENKAPEISSDYLEAWARLQLLKIDEIKIYLRMTPRERLLTFEMTPVPEAALNMPSSSRSRAATTTAICPPSIIPSFEPAEQHAIDKSRLEGRSTSIISGDSRRFGGTASQPSARDLIKTGFLADQIKLQARMEEQFPLKISDDDEDDDELMFKIDL